MSKRPNHTTMGLAFILGCLIIAFAIHVGIKTAPKTIPTNTTIAADGNAADREAAPAAASDNATATADSGLPSAPLPSQPDPAPQEASPRASDQNSSSPPAAASEGALLPHAQFVAACIAKDGDALNGMDDVDRSAMCECIYDHGRTYAKLTPENGRAAIELCRLRWVTDRSSFRNDYAPRDDTSGAAQFDQQEPR